MTGLLTKNTFQLNLKVSIMMIALLPALVFTWTGSALAESSLNFSSSSTTSSTSAAGQAMPKLSGTSHIHNPYERRYLAAMQEAERAEAQRILLLEKERIREKKRKEKEELLAQKKKEQELRRALRRHQMAIGKHNKIISERERHFSLYKENAEREASAKGPLEHLDKSPDSNPENADLWGELK